MEWQPIETAPRDGSWVLVTGGKPDYHHDGLFDIGVPIQTVASAFWEDSMEPGWRYTSYDDGYYGRWEEATHWMPLPPPPSVDKD